MAASFESVYLQLARGGSYGPMPRETVVQWARQGRVPVSSVLIDDATGESKYVEDFPDIAAAFARTLFGARIPGNRPAVAAYFVAMFSLPLVWLIIPGAIGGCVAAWLGFKGLRVARAHPILGGRRHAWAAIVLGLLELIPGLIVAVHLLYKMIMQIKF